MWSMVVRIVKRGERLPSSGLFCGWKQNAKGRNGFTHERSERIYFALTFNQLPVAKNKNPSTDVFRFT
jgi:hypothetical protein